ncbi:hypothetical protein MMB17_07435 [Methylobacterium organophilum]|uniref:hypothetical protein n=1 Tax=Methylobacterium organophilum TaxID=410 RepID=UPI001F1321A2|nr:hypothetical protein [Methylobacterium organophilum]UMY19122.1 hypothetical protein MMB17_07435 [Methylobacterium organophilum]
MAIGVSGRKLAELLGVSEKAVRKAEEAGRIKKLADGSYDPAQAQQDWHRSTDPARTKVRTSADQGPHLGPQGPQSAAPPVRTEEDARAALTLLKQVLQEEGAEDADGGIDFGKARTADMILKARERAMGIAKARGELVEIEVVGAAVEKAFSRCRARLLAIPGNLAQALTNEPDPHVVRDRLFAEVSKALNALSADFGPDPGAAGATAGASGAEGAPSSA